MSEPSHPQDDSVVDVVDRDITVIEIEHDTCDACGARPYVYVAMKDGRSLAYCGHHGTVFMANLQPLADRIIDRRYLIAP